MTAGEFLQQLLFREGPEALLACHSRRPITSVRRWEAPMRKGSKSLRLFSAPQEKPQLGRKPRAWNVRGGCYAHQMGEACTELDARLEAVANAAALLGSRLPRVRDPALGRWMAHAIDALLRNISSGHGGLDGALGEGLGGVALRRPAVGLSYSHIWGHPPGGRG